MKSVSGQEIIKNKIKSFSLKRKAFDFKL